MQTAQLNVVTRPVGSTKGLRELRAKGLVPATIYGPGLKNQNCAFSEKELRKAVGTNLAGNILLTLTSDIADLKGKQVLVKSVDRDPLTSHWLHADLYEVAAGRPITVDVPLTFKGSPDGVRNGGGIFQVIRRSVRVKALVADIPKTIEVDVTDLALDTSIHIKEVKFPEKLTILDSGEFTLAGVFEADKEEVVTPATAVAAGTGTAAAASTAAPAADAAKGGDAKKGGEPAKKADAAKK